MPATMIDRLSAMLDNARCAHAWEEMNPGMWICKEMCGAEADVRNSPDWKPPAEPSDDLAQWLFQRYYQVVRTDNGEAWRALSADDRAYWEKDAVAVRDAVGPRPLLDRAAVLSLFRGPNACGYWLENIMDDHEQEAAADAVMEMARPMPTAEQIAMKLSLVRFSDEQSDRMIELTMREAWPLAGAVVEMLTRSDS
jgi:hypothetical protein